MTDTLPVLFRRPRGNAEFAMHGVTAVFPTIPGTDAYDMTCYAHVGQHSSCGLSWYYTTSPAKPEEYASLLSELRGIYEEGEDAVALRVVQRITARHKNERRRNAR